MRLLPILQAALLAGTECAFSPASAFGVSPNRDTRQSSALHISSWGTKSTPSSLSDDANKSPADNVQAYLKTPEAVEARSNIDGTVLVSGLVRSKERTDQVIFDLLNNGESAFEFETIIAFVDDIAFAKKRLLSRSARYSGLLDKLDFVEASVPGGLPSPAQLEGVKSWVAVLDADDLVNTVSDVTAVIKQTGTVKNIAILAANAANIDSSDEKQIVESLKGCGAKFTMVAVGELQDFPEGTDPYSFYEMGSSESMVAEDATFSRDEAMRMITECLQLEAGVNKALSFSKVTNVNATEAKLIKGLREAGYARPQEVDHMLRDGVSNYKKAIADFMEKNPDYEKGYTSDVWWEEEKFQKSVRKSALRSADENQKIKDSRVEEVEKIAREWAKREYFRQMMAGTVDAELSEESFLESVWERAMFEGDLVYRQINGEATDADAELEDFKAKQERKKQAMLKKAKSELKEILEEENLGGDDLNEKLDKMDANPEGAKQS
ncbi:unnamed protein product [Cylindrotheca closterium]|uniref:Uncharacterized protein n=1 Tax=Cylindrotheca closterium TaxID=2856 RepID=A0AAD2PXJ1_9STRA|nr:unnamed protein product [Cylindrotheca closterium]